MSYNSNKNVNNKEVLKRLRNGSTLKENKEIWQLNAKCEPRFSPGVEEYQLSSTLCDNELSSMAYRLIILNQCKITWLW